MCTSLCACSFAQVFTWRCLATPRALPRPEPSLATSAAPPPCACRCPLCTPRGAWWAVWTWWWSGNTRWWSVVSSHFRFFDLHEKCICVHACLFVRFSEMCLCTSCLFSSVRDVCVCTLACSVQWEMSVSGFVQVRENWKSRGETEKLFQSLESQGM